MPSVHSQDPITGFGWRNDKTVEFPFHLRGDIHPDHPNTSSIAIGDPLPVIFKDKSSQPANIWEPVIKPRRKLKPRGVSVVTGKRRRRTGTPKTRAPPKHKPLKNPPPCNDRQIRIKRHQRKYPS